MRNPPWKAPEPTAALHSAASIVDGESSDHLIEAPCTPFNSVCQRC
jgi:hypothetical protein